MRFFSRVVFICNGCFVVAVIMNIINNAHKKNIHFSGAIQINPLESTLVIMGYGAIFINFIFNIFVLALLVTKSKQTTTRWIIWANFIFLLTQIFYFFIL